MPHKPNITKRIIWRITGIALAALTAFSAFEGYPAKVLASQPVTSQGAVSDVLAGNTIVDISSGSFAGTNAEFYFYLPPEWFDTNGKPLISVKRITYAENREILDWYNVEYWGGGHESALGPGYLRRWMVLRLYVFDRSKWRDELYPLTIILKTRDYVFAFSRGTLSPEMSKSERADMNTIINAIGNVSLIKRCIILAEGLEEEPTRAVIVNGEVLDTHLELIDNTYYVALRDVCEAFGYEVLYNNATRRISIIQDGSLVDEFVLDVGTVTALSPKYSLRFINDRVYMAAAYFVGVLDKSVEIDEADNIILYSKPRR